MKPNVKLLSKNSHGCYSDSDTSSCKEKYVSNSNSPSPTSLKDFINGLPHFEPLHFGFYLNDDKKPSASIAALIFALISDGFGKTAA